MEIIYLSSMIVVKPSYAFFQFRGVLAKRVIVINNVKLADIIPNLTTLEDKVCIMDQ